jgi:hypothetical protein
MARERGAGLHIFILTLYFFSPKPILLGLRTSSPFQSFLQHTFHQTPEI